MPHQTSARPRRVLLAGVLFAAFALPLGAQLPAGITKGVTVEGITEYTLDNGLHVLLFPDASKPTATINITYFVGSRHEGYGETGMAHLLEHLVFKGTPKHPNIPQELTEHGSRPNGTTWYDRTNYFETVPATDENITWALDLEADRMVNSFIARKDLESEFTVVRNEFESGENSPTRVLLERGMSTAYLWHNYGKSTIGSRSDIENVPIERLQAFYRRYYQPDNSLLVVAGKIDQARVLKLIAEKFGPIPKPVRSLDRGNMIYPTYTAEPTQDGEREVSLRRTGDVQVAMAMYHVPAGTHPDFAPVAILAEVLNTRPAGRLYKALVESSKASSTSAFSWLLREPGVLVAQATVRKEQPLDDARKTLIETVEATVTSPPTAEEVDRAKATMVKNLELTLTNSEWVGLDLSEWASAGDWRLVFIHRDRLKEVKPADVQRVAATYIKPANRTVALFYPTEKPDRAEIPVVTDSMIAALVSNYKGNAALAEGEVFDASPANIDARTIRSTLPNGMKVALLPKETRGDVVRAQVTLRFGDEKSLMGRVTAARFMSGMLDKGTRSRTRQQIRDEFDRLKAQVFFGGSGNAINAGITTTRQNLIPTLRLVAEVLKQPSFDPAEFEKLRTERLANIEQFRSEPTTIAFNVFNQKIAPYPKEHPLATIPTDDEIAQYKALTNEDVKKVYTELVGATYGDVAIAGDFHKDSVTAVLRELFGSWKSPKPFTRLVRSYFDVKPFTEKIETPDKANAFFLAGQNLKLRDDSKDYAALALGNYMLGGGFLNSRLATRIRQQEGISYGVNSGLSAQQLDSVGTFQANAIYNPENVLRLEAAFNQEIDKVLREGFTAEEVEKAKQGWLQQQLQNRAVDQYLVSLFSNQALTSRNMSYNVQLEKWVAALTPAEVNAAMKKYLDLTKMSIVRAGDFAKHPPKNVIVP
jgi:zinc protease